ncbi:hypothetical protein [Streptomyces sp. NPDC102437]|uniref:hypothetical protein n=1 Tax=Streptomyces sp. NPDC102437 TaxID=3366175 RepID=UPI003810994F
MTTESITPDQIRTIRRLLREQAQDGEAGTVGFYKGPTDPDGIASLSRQEADLYIDSLRGDY